MDKDKKYLIVVAGPTAVGKTSLSIKLADKYGCPIISADSRLVYREMHIGTAKPSFEERLGISHYLIDTRSIDEHYDVGMYEKDFLEISTLLFKEHRSLLLVGGTGLYIKAALEGLDSFPGVKKAVLAKWEQVSKEKGISILQESLQKMDPLYATLVDMQNPARLIRALAVTESSGRPYSSFLQGETRPREFTPIRILLELPREELYNKIDQRVDSMIEDGLVEEVKSLFDHRQRRALKTVGYQELFAYLKGKYTLEEAISKIKQHSRNYAKRQLTWFRKERGWERFHPEDHEGILGYLGRWLQWKKYDDS